MTKQEALNKAAQEFGYDDWADVELSSYELCIHRAMDIYAGGWVSVEERLPGADWHKSVLIFDPNNPFDNGICVANFSEFNLTFYINGSDVIHPTHWQPLPTAP